MDHASFSHSEGDFLLGGGEMGQRMRDKDWTHTIFGPVEKWPHSLKTSISIMLASRFAMVVAWGPDFRFFYNDRYRPVLGATKHPGALGTPATEIFPEAWPFIGPLFESTRRGDSVALDDVLIPLERYGYLENCYFTLSYSPIRDESGGVGGMLAVVAETTERVEGERRLKTLRELARRSAEAASPEQACQNAAETLHENPIDVPFALFYRVVADGALAQLVGSCGIARNLMASPGAVDLTLRNEMGWCLGEIAQTREACVFNDIEDRFGRLPGGPYPEPANTAVVMPISRPGQAHPDAILVFGVSPRRMLDDTYRGFYDLAADHILTAVRNALARQEERERAEALAELDRAKTAFFSNVSHEFRTPLTLMLGPLEDTLSAQNALPGETRSQIEVAHRNGLRLLKLVNTLLDFSRIEAGRMQAAFEPLDLAAYTAELASVFRSAVERASLEFRVNCSAFDEPVYVDREMWEKIVFNLLSNAFKFTFEGHIAVSLVRTEKDAQLLVSDTGTGIPAEDIPHVFERFYRVKGARGRTYEGTGIGLALVRELARFHAGDIEVRSRLGEGSVFVVTVPLGHAHLAPERIGASRTVASTALRGDVYVEEALRWLPQSAAGEAETTAGKAHILLADDNTDMRNYVEGLLAEKFRVTSVVDGRAALEAAQHDRPDLILSDIMMPRMDGRELVKAARSDPKLRTVPMILLSARAGEEARVEGLSGGANDYMIKPFSARELIARIETHLQMSRVLRQSEERERARAEELEALMAAVPAVVFIAEDPECRVIHGSRCAYELLRVPVNTNLSVTADDPERPQHFRIFRNGVEMRPDELPVQTAARGEDVNDSDLEIVFNDGSQRYLWGSAVPLRDGSGELRGSIAAFVDITERKRVEQRLALQYKVARIFADSKEATEALTCVLQAVGETMGWDAGSVWNHDSDSQRLNCITVWHQPTYPVPNFEAASRQHQFEIGIGLPGRVWKMGTSVWIADVAADDNFPRLVSAARDGLHTGAAFPVLLHGSLLCVVEFFSRKVLREDPELLQLMDAIGSQLGQFVERKRMEEERARMLESELKAKNEAETANRLKDEFLATVSHELRTPLNAMLGWARLLRAGKVEEDRKGHALEVMERNAIAQQQIIEDILDVSRIITGKLRLQIAPTELAPIVDAAVDSVKPAADAKGVILELKPGSETSLVFGDANRLQQIVWNLLSNAVKFTPRGGRVTVMIERGDAYVEITVRDTGKGMAQEFLPYVFERFRQADSSSTRQFGGLGLGLAIVRHLTELHGGTVHVSSAGENLGATFKIRLPLAITHVNQELLHSEVPFRQNEETRSPSGFMSSLEGVRILVVDDEADARDLLSFILLRTNADVRTAGSVQEALKIVPEWKPAVLLSDIGMPLEDGYSLIRLVRSLPPEQGGNVAAAALTAYARSEDRVRALAAGYQTHVTKPVEPAELVAVVASLAGRAGTVPP
jgi:signal transduction histidine kinase/DNA-binding response OmpR family regulator